MQLIADSAIPYSVYSYPYTTYSYAPLYYRSWYGYPHAWHEWHGWHGHPWYEAHEWREHHHRW
jgi:hypothetical protein